MIAMHIILTSAGKAYENCASFNIRILNVVNRAYSLPTPL